MIITDQIGWQPFACEWVYHNEVRYGAEVEWYYRIGNRYIPQTSVPGWRRDEL